jgi:hypothetical protein
VAHNSQLIECSNFNRINILTSTFGTKCSSDELSESVTRWLEKGHENLGAHHGLEGEGDDAGMNINVREVEVGADRGARDTVEEANDAPGFLGSCGCGQIPLR